MFCILSQSSFPKIAVCFVVDFGIVAALSYNVTMTRVMESQSLSVTVNSHLYHPAVNLLILPSNSHFEFRKHSASLCICAFVISFYKYPSRDCIINNKICL